MTRRDALAATVERLREQLKTMLCSAVPHPTEHPTMYAAWAGTHAALAATPAQDLNVVKAAVLRDLADETNVFDAVLRAWLRKMADDLERAAAANERAEKAEAELNSHIGKQALKEMLRQMLRNAEEKDALAATVERLRGALREVDALRTCEDVKMDSAVRYRFATSRQNEVAHVVIAALAATPAQNLAKVKAEALELLESIGHLEYVEIWRDPTESLVRISGTVYRGPDLLAALREARKAAS